MLTNKNVPLEWKDHPNNPLIYPPFPSHMLADPTFLLPEETPDGLWHMFAHTVFFGFSFFSILHFTSLDGVRWKKLPGVVVKSSLRPFVFKGDGKYFLLFERALRILPKNSSQIEIASSADLMSWKENTIILKPTLEWHKEGMTVGAVSNPCLLRDQGVYKLFFSASLVYLNDCKFSEPKYIGCATSENILGPYSPIEKPLITPDEHDPFLNLAAGSIKVIQYDNGFLGFQNGIYWDPISKHSGSAIRLWQSHHGYDWTLVSHTPIIRPGIGWKKSHVYANDVRFAGDRWIMFFNARNGWFFGGEKIGRADSIIMA